MTIEEWQSISRFFSKKLSGQLIVNHIYPYAYEPQPQDLLEDIKSFSSEYQEVEKIYKELFTVHHFWFDIYNFLMQKEPPVGWYHNGKSVPIRDQGPEGPFINKVIKRIYRLKDATKGEIFYYRYLKISKYASAASDMDPDSEELLGVCKQFFALFTHDERVDFKENWINRNVTPRKEYLEEIEETKSNITSTIMDSFINMADY